ncbi:phage portal protein [Limosilactobacillus reuteri]|uniref:Phage portal protein n=1 Tax=Limosilactobacillus reuteri TaxID=1598 RepID=A0A1Y2URS4_LIMRT|nr:phage portal protein [Limosilactobacillus reuteri]OTA51516.1 phage portal protein [Limosilactobacillus reuteri]OTA83177.1 phage portal protein [Limosilactobacillus reuteri]OTA86940.1 phage portal protein [Limosilactobacillus reuteri]
MSEIKGQVVEGNVFIYPKDDEITMADLLKFISKNKSLAEEYKHNLEMYKGNHNILNKQPRQFGPDNKLVANLPHYIVDTYNGFFTGIPPKVTLDDKETNSLLQEWNDENSLQDKLSEISKQADIFGRSLAFVYQDEDSQTRIAYSSPVNSFMVYDDTVSRQPLAFVRYWKNTDGIQVGMVYYSDKTISFEGSKFGDEMLNPYKMVPAVEFYGNEERQGVFDNVKTLIDELDRVLSQKANQVEYFDNAYLKILGVDLDQDGDGKPDADLIGNQMIYSPDADATNATVDFISKPDGDNMQEHIIDRLVSMIYQISMVANLNDEAFAGNSSGVALQYKLLPMRNMAANKERKFRQALRRLYRIVFSVGTVLPEVHSEDWRELVFTFKRNLPDDISNDADIAQRLQGMVSQETLLSILPFVNDPQEEIKRINKEKQENMQQALKYGPAALDQDKPDGDEDGDAE